MADIYVTDGKVFHGEIIAIKENYIHIKRKYSEEEKKKYGYKTNYNHTYILFKGIKDEACRSFFKTCSRITSFSFETVLVCLYPFIFDDICFTVGFRNHDINDIQVGYFDGVKKQKLVLKSKHRKGEIIKINIDDIIWLMSDNEL